MWNERHVQILNAVKTKSGRSWPAGRLCIAALADGSVMQEVARRKVKKQKADRAA